MNTFYKCANVLATIDSVVHVIRLDRIRWCIVVGVNVSLLLCITRTEIMTNKNETISIDNFITNNCFFFLVQCLIVIGEDFLFLNYKRT